MKLFDRNLLAELTTDDTWMDRLRRVIERKDRNSFEMMGPYTNSLWHQMAVVDDCIIVDRRLAVPGQLRPAVLQRIHRGHPGQEAMWDVSRYLRWPHMHKDIVNMAEECRSCTHYGKNVKYFIPKNASKPLPLLTQPGQELQLDYAGPLEDKKRKMIYLLTAIDRYSKFPSVKITKSTGGKSSVKFLRTYIDTHGIPESIRIDQFSGFKGKTMKKFCTKNNIEQKFCPVGDHRGCGLVERTIQTIKRRLGVMLLDENVTSKKLALSTIIRDLRWSKQKTTKCSPFEAHFGRLSKTEFKIVRDTFKKISDRLDKEHLERSAHTASQLKRRVDQSRNNVKIVRKSQNSGEVSPMFKSELESAKDRDRAKALRTLLEANARWNATRRDTSASDIRRKVDETSTIDPELRKELLYSWENGFLEDKPEKVEPSSTNLLRKDEGRKSGKALTNPLKGKVQLETPHTVKTAAGAIYRKSDIAQTKINTSDMRDKSPKKEQSRQSPHGDEPKSKSKKKEGGSRKKNSDSEEMPDIQKRSNLENAVEFYQDSQQNVTSKELEVNGGLNLGVKRAKPKNAGPVRGNAGGSEPKGVGKKDKKSTCQEARKPKAAITARQRNQADEEEMNTMSFTEKACTLSTSTPRKEMRDKSKEITQNSSAEKILETFQSRDLATEDWNLLADQVLTRGVQKEAETILKNADTSGDEGSNAPPGFSDESGETEVPVRRSGRQTKNKGPIRFGNPVKHSIKLITTDQDITDLNKAALEAYRFKLATFKADANKPVETKLGLLEKHLFCRKFGSEALDITKT